VLAALKRVNGVLGIIRQESFRRDGLEKEVEDLIQERERARKERDYGRADDIRSRLIEMGIVLEDTAEGVKWRRK
jgi:cysteinyl-tRNA synthetase